MTSRRAALRTLFAGAAAAFAAPAAVGAAMGPAAQPKIIAYKSPTCGCCGDWAEHMRANGFVVEEVEVEDVLVYKKKYGVPLDLASCHTGIVHGYAIEGHVPADLVHKLLREKPPGIKGLATPGMPLGSPGMEVPGRKDPYNVMAFDAKSGRRLYARR